MIHRDIVISRKEARERDLKFYYTGALCKQGHVAKRRVSNHCCCECEKDRWLDYREKARAIGRRYYQANKVKESLRKQRYYQEHKKTAVVSNRQEAIAKGLTKYVSAKPCLRGHIAERSVSDNRCRECIREDRQKKSDALKIKSREYYRKNKERHRSRSKEYERKNKAKMEAARRSYYENNRERLLLQSKTYRNKNRERTNEKFNNDIREDIQFKIKHYLRTSLRRAIRLRQKSGSAVKDLGCSIEEFRSHIESKFYGGMTWDNWGKAWHLDHIEPLGLFDLTDRQQFLKVAHYTNYQPLTIKEHKRKTSIDRKIIANQRKSQQEPTKIVGRNQEEVGHEFRKTKTEIWAAQVPTHS